MSNHLEDFYNFIFMLLIMRHNDEGLYSHECLNCITHCPMNKSICNIIHPSGILFNEIQ